MAMADQGLHRVGSLPSNPADLASNQAQYLAAAVVTNATPKIAPKHLHGCQTANPQTTGPAVIAEFVPGRARHQPVIPGAIERKTIMPVGLRLRLLHPGQRGCAAFKRQEQSGPRSGKSPGWFLQMPAPRSGEGPKRTPGRANFASLNGAGVPPCSHSPVCDPALMATPPFRGALARVQWRQTLGYTFLLIPSASLPGRQWALS